MCSNVGRLRTETGPGRLAMTTIDEKIAAAKAQAETFLQEHGVAKPAKFPRNYFPHQEFPSSAPVSDLTLRRVEASLKQNLADAQRAAEEGHTRQMLELGFATAAELVHDAQGELARVAGDAIAKAVRNLLDAKFAQVQILQSPGPADVPGVSRGCPVSDPAHVGTSHNTCELDRILQPAPSPSGDAGCVSLKDYLTPPGAWSPMGWPGPDLEAHSRDVLIAELQTCLDSLRSSTPRLLHPGDRYWLQAVLEMVRHA